VHLCLVHAITRQLISELWQFFIAFVWLCEFSESTVMALRAFRVLTVEEITELVEFICILKPAVLKV
jgi:hypothetical protein